MTCTRTLHSARSRTRSRQLVKCVTYDPSGLDRLCSRRGWGRRRAGYKNSVVPAFFLVALVSLPKYMYFCVDDILFASTMCALLIVRLAGCVQAPVASPAAQKVSPAFACRDVCLEVSCRCLCTWFGFLYENHLLCLAVWTAHRLVNFLFVLRTTHVLVLVFSLT